MQPDSSGYLNLSKTRQTTYYYLIQSLNLIGIDIITFQKILLSFSVVLLFFFFKKKTNLFLGLTFYLLVVLNIYYSSFAKTLLTESILFSTLNIAIVYLFDLDQRKNLIIFSLMCGILAALKPIGIPISIFLIVIAAFKIRKISRIFLLLTLWIIPNVLENLSFYNKHIERETVFKQSVIGKLFILSGKDSFIISEYPKEFQDLLRVSKDEFKLINNYLENLNNILLRTELLADYEVVAQYQTFNFQKIKLLEFEKDLLLRNSTKLFLEILKNNPIDYFLLSFQHYLGNWSIGSKARYLNDSISEVPRYQELLKSSGPMKLPDRKLLELAQLFFLLLFIIITIYSILVLLFFCRIINFKLSSMDSILIFFIQTYLILICLTNVSTPRYLMVVYPLIIMMSIRFIDLIKYKIIKVKN